MFSIIKKTVDWFLYGGIHWSLMGQLFHDGGRYHIETSLVSI